MMETNESKLNKIGTVERLTSSMNKRLFIKPVLLIAGTSLLMTGCVVRERTVYRNPPPPAYAGDEVVVTEPAPPEIVETETVMPGPGFIWIGGYWGWGGGRWAWHRGYWGHPPRAGVVWVHPHYEFRGGRHVWIRGGWR